jgi:hypothetical protein
MRPASADQLNEEAAPVDRGLQGPPPAAKKPSKASRKDLPKKDPARLRYRLAVPQNRQISISVFEMAAEQDPVGQGSKIRRRTRRHDSSEVVDWQRVRVGP